MKSIVTLLAVMALSFVSCTKHEHSGEETGTHGDVPAAAPIDPAVAPTEPPAPGTTPPASSPEAPPSNVEGSEKTRDGLEK